MPRYRVSIPEIYYSIPKVYYWTVEVEAENEVEALNSADTTFVADLGTEYSHTLGLEDYVIEEINSEDE